MFLHASQDVAGKGSFKSLSWSELDVHARVRYEDMARNSRDIARQESGGIPALPPLTREHIAQCSPLGLGDDSYPISSSIMDDVAANVSSLSRKWVERVGDVVPSSVETKASGMEYPCSYSVGIGNCLRGRTPADDFWRKSVSDAIMGVSLMGRSPFLSMPQLVIICADVIQIKLAQSKNIIFV